MFIRFASAASAVALVTCLATPAFAAEGEEIVVVAETEILDSDTTQRAIAPIDYDTASRQADEEPAITISGSAALVSDYRFRGVSQSDEGIALQGGFTVSHESGFYVGTWASNLAGWGTFGGANLELDIFAGYTLPVGEGTLDVGGT